MAEGEEHAACGHVICGAQIMMVLADTLVEASEQRQRGGEESASEDWETDSGAEDDM